MNTRNPYANPKDITIDKYKFEHLGVFSVRNILSDFINTHDDFSIKGLQQFIEEYKDLDSAISEGIMELMDETQLFYYRKFESKDRFILNEICNLFLEEYKFRNNKDMIIEILMYIFHGKYISKNLIKNNYCDIEEAINLKFKRITEKMFLVKESENNFNTLKEDERRKQLENYDRFFISDFQTKNIYDGINLYENIIFDIWGIKINNDKIKKEKDEQKLNDLKHKISNLNKTLKQLNNEYENLQKELAATLSV